MKAQFLFRQMPWRHAGQYEKHGYAWGGVGIIETNAQIEENALYQVNSVGQKLKIQGKASRIDPAHKYGEISSLFTALSFSAPRQEFGIGGGGLIVRKTAIAASCPGNMVYLAIIVLRDEDLSFDNKTIYSSDDQDGYFKFHPERQIDFEPNGMAMAQIHKQPIWGWDEEEWGPNSTLDLEIISQAQAFHDSPDPDKHQDQSIPYEIRALFRHGNDDKYRAFADKMKAAGHDIRWDGVTTQSQSARRSQDADRIMREILSAA